MDSDYLVRKRVSYILKLIVAIAAIVGITLNYYADMDTFMGEGRIFMFFTIQSNILIAIICIIGCILMMRDKPVGDVWYVIKFVGTVAITLTGMVFCFVLAPTLGPNCWNVHNILTHVIVPVCAVADFFVTDSGAGMSKRNVVYVIIPPALYSIYAGIGYISGWEFIEGYNYPYFFLNWGSPAGAFGFIDELPFMGSGWWMIVLFIFLIVVGYCYLVIADKINKKR